VHVDYRLLFPNDYIAAHDLRGKDVTKTIKSVTVEKLRMTGGRVEKKPVVQFSDTPKKLVLNKTNAKVVAAHHGTDTDKWAGKKVTLYPTTTLFGKDTVDCVRVREKAAARTSHVPDPASPDEDPFDIDGSETVADDEPPADVPLVGQEG
jgi:hypothetical protein